MFSNRQEALLTAISEKDSNIANLEVDNNQTPSLKNEINRLYEEKDNLHQQLKQLVSYFKENFSVII